MNYLGLALIYIGTLIIFYHYDTKLDKKMENRSDYNLQIGELKGSVYENGKKAYVVAAIPREEK